MEKIKKTGFALMMMVFPAAGGLFAQSATGEIHGKVFEKPGLTYIGALVWVDVNGGQVKATTDEDGRYVLKPLDAGTYVMHLAIEKDTIDFETRVTANEITKMKDIDLTSPEVKGQMMGTVDIIGYKDPLIRVDNASMEIVRAKELEHSPARRDVKAIIQSQTSGVKVTETGDAYVRGSRADAINYYLDGMRLRDGFKTPPASAIASVAVFTGGVPARYGDCTGGVVVIETKNYLSLYQEWLALQGR